MITALPPLSSSGYSTSGSLESELPVSLLPLSVSGIFSEFGSISGSGFFALVQTAYAMSPSSFS